MAISADLVGEVSKAAIQPLNEVAAPISTSLSSAIAGLATAKAIIAAADSVFKVWLLMTYSSLQSTLASRQSFMA